MTENLISYKSAAQKLGISVRSLHRYRASLIAKGLQCVRAGQRVLFRESSIDRVIANAAERDEALYGGSENG